MRSIAEEIASAEALGPCLTLEMAFRLSELRSHWRVFKQRNDGT